MYVIDAMAVLICAAVPAIVTVPVPLFVIVAPPVVTTDSVPVPAGTDSVVVSVPPSTSATDAPEITTAVSSVVVCATGTLCVGASLTDDTVMLTVAVSVTPPEVTVYVNDGVPL